MEHQKLEALDETSQLKQEILDLKKQLDASIEENLDLHCLLDEFETEILFLKEEIEELNYEHQNELRYLQDSFDENKEEV